MTDPQDRVEEAIEVLAAMGLPRAQQNERSALTLLGLLDLAPDAPWTAATRPLRGITPLMTFMEQVYGKTYAPNTRETVRRFTMHQFVEAGVAVSNPDRPDRPVNSPKWCYQVSDAAFDLVRTYGTDAWSAALAEFLDEIGSLKERWAKRRDMEMIPVTGPHGEDFKLSPGGQNDLVKAIVEDFCSRFTPGGHLIYVGDAGEKWAVFDEDHLASLGVQVDAHGKMPDVVVHFTDENWLVLIEAVTSHGPVNPKRVTELRELFAGSTAGLVFVTAFETRQAFARYVYDISWETEVWIADAPTHMVHFDGKRFLGPYDDT